MASDSTVSQGVLQQLGRTKPWVRFMSVLMFIGAGFMLLAAVVMLVAGGAIAVSAKTSGSTIPAGMMSGIAIFYALLSGIYIYPGVKLWKYASSIAALLFSGAVLDLESALNEQRAFWKYLGIMVITMFVLYILVVIAIVALGGMAAIGGYRAHGGSATPF